MPKLKQIKEGSWALVTVTMDNGKQLMADGKPAQFPLAEARRVSCIPDELRKWLDEKGHTLGHPDPPAKAKG